MELKIDIVNVTDVIDIVNVTAFFIVMGYYLAKQCDL